MRWRILSVVAALVGVGFLFYALSMTQFLLSVRLEGSDDFPALYRLSAKSGIAIAVGVALIGATLIDKISVKRIAVLAMIAIAAGSTIGGGVVWIHVESHRVRSTMD
jgi:hypothetical protein